MLVGVQTGIRRHSTPGKYQHRRTLVVLSSLSTSNRGGSKTNDNSGVRCECISQARLLRQPLPPLESNRNLIPSCLNCGG